MVKKFNIPHKRQRYIFQNVHLPKEGETVEFYPEMSTRKIASLHKQNGQLFIESFDRESLQYIAPDNSKMTCCYLEKDSRGEFIIDDKHLPKINDKTIL